MLQLEIMLGYYLFKNLENSNLKIVKRSEVVFFKGN